MKRLKHIYKLILLFGLIGLFSCTDGFEELNTDPDSFNESPPENLFAGVVKSTLDHVGGTLNDRMFVNYASYQGGKGGQFQKFGNANGVDDYYNTFFVDVLKNNQEIIDNYSENPDYANRVHIAKIWKSYVYSIVVSTFGGVPMSEAFGDAESKTVAYDSEEAIYSAILTLLKDAAEGIDLAGDALGQDPIFNGDNSKWKKFANSLRLKIALRISTGFPALAQEHGTAAMTNESGLISSESESAFMQWGTEVENWSFNYDRYVFGDLGQSSDANINANFLLHLKTYNDSRVSAFVEPSEEPFVLTEWLLAEGSTTDYVLVSYPIPYLGKTLGNRTLDAWDLNNNDNVAHDPSDVNSSTINRNNFCGIDMKFHIISLAEMNLMKAEAKLKGWGGSKTAEEYYYEGIDASFSQYSVSGADAYKEQDGIKWGTESAGLRGIYGLISSGISTDNLDRIIRQRWIVMFNQGHDAWCMQKRTRLLPFRPHTNPDGTATTGGETYAEIPERMIYAPVEEAVNEAAYSAAVTALDGFDEMTTPLKMNKEYTRINWENASAEFNIDFGSQWYGNSVDDLIAAGVEYTIVSGG